MQNRRQHYRHAFPANHRLQATLAYQDGVVCHIGEILDLSIGGMGVKLDHFSVSVEESCAVSFVLGENNDSTQVRAERVHTHQSSAQYLGLRFLFPIHMPTRDDLERKIAKYLFDVQRYERQLLRELKTAHDVT
jgi:c-di-GMP-binding flagellar brake protein YcgR